MNILQFSTALGLGDMIITRSALESGKHYFDRIDVSFPLNLIEIYRGTTKNEYIKFAHEFCSLIYSDDKPYNLQPYANYPFIKQDLLPKYGFTYHKPEKFLSERLCYGSPLDIDNYIVLNTKVRYLHINRFKSMSADFWQILNTLGNKFKIVILGERLIEPNWEYINHHVGTIYSIYDEAIKHLNHDYVIDLTIPALGITVPNIDKIRQDCLIMNKAKFCITIGVGGAFCLSVTVADKIIGFVEDTPYITDAVNAISDYYNYFLYRDNILFINKLKEQV